MSVQKLCQTIPFSLQNRRTLTSHLFPGYKRFWTIAGLTLHSS